MVRIHIVALHDGRTLRVPLGCASILATAVLFFVNTALADPFSALSQVEQNAKPAFVPSAEMLDAAAKMDPQLMELLRRQGAVIRGEKESSVERMAKQPPANFERTVLERVKKKPIVVIKGSGGEPLIPAPPAIRLDAALLDEVANNQIRDSKAALKAQLQLKPAPDCRESKTVLKKFTRDGPRPKESTVVFDMLFIRGDKIPLDAKEYYGTQPMIIPYNTEGDIAGALAAQGVGVSCLPTRQRITSLGTYIHLGDDALKNYDADPDGPGEVHPALGRKGKQDLRPRGNRN